jgi:hypothetical protein
VRQQGIQALKPIRAAFQANSWLLQGLLSLSDCDIIPKGHHELTMAGVPGIVLPQSRSIDGGAEALKFMRLWMPDAKTELEPVDAREI